MNTLVIYASQTGFTEKYARWLAERTGADLLPLKEARRKKPDFFSRYDAIAYGGWTMAGSLVHAKWFMEQASAWTGKRLAVFLVGAGPAENPETEQYLEKLLAGAPQKNIRAFYCPGGIDYDKMNAPSRIAMKALSSMLKKKKDATEQERAMASWIDHSYDVSDEKYIIPAAEYLTAR